MARHLMLICLVLCVAEGTNLRAQEEASSAREIQMRFEDPAAVQWTRTFKGTWQSFHPVEITLAFDGKEYYGKMICGTPGNDL